MNSQASNVTKPQNSLKEWFKHDATWQQRPEVAPGFLEPFKHTFSFSTLKAALCKKATKKCSYCCFIPLNSFTRFSCETEGPDNKVPLMCFSFKVLSRLQFTGRLQLSAANTLFYGRRVNLRQTLCWEKHLNSFVFSLESLISQNLV